MMTHEDFRAYVKTFGPMNTWPKIVVEHLVGLRLTLDEPVTTNTPNADLLERLKRRKAGK